MTAIATFPVMEQAGTHAARPAASAVGSGAQYWCTTHKLVYQQIGGAWGTFFDLTTLGFANPMTTAEDIIFGGASGAPTRKAKGSDGTFLGVASGALLYQAVTDALLSTSDITTNNVSTSKHGFAPKLPNDATKYLDGTGAYTVPAGGGGGGAWTLLSSDVLGSAAADITRTGLSSAYKDLIVVWTCRSASASTKALNMRLGAGASIDTGSNYAYTRNYTGTIGSGATGGTGQSVIEVGSVNGSGSTAGYFSSGRIEIIDYATTRAKACVFQAYGLGDDGTLGSQGGGVWQNVAAALDSVRLYGASGNLDTGSRMYIYGRV